MVTASLIAISSMILLVASTSFRDFASSKGLSQSNMINVGVSVSVGVGIRLVALVRSIILAIWANKNRPGWTRDL